MVNSKLTRVESPNLLLRTRNESGKGNLVYWDYCLEWCQGKNVLRPTGDTGAMIGVDVQAVRASREFCSKMLAKSCFSRNHVWNERFYALYGWSTRRGWDNQEIKRSRDLRYNSGPVQGRGRRRNRYEWTQRIHDLEWTRGGLDELPLRILRFATTENQ